MRTNQRKYERDFSEEIVDDVHNNADLGVLAVHAVHEWW